MDLDDFFNKNYTYAIVGASNNKEKYGYKISQSLLQAKFKVFLINPKETEILGEKVYPSLDKLPSNVDVVDFVVPPPVTLKILEEVNKKNINKVWFQPGSYDNKCIMYCKKNKINFIKDFCLLETTLKYLNDQ